MKTSGYFYSFTTFAFALVLMAGLKPPADPAPAEAIGRIDSVRAKRHVDALASDEMGGRDTPSPGLDSAARYIAAQFQRAGARPVAGSYFHNFSLKIEQLGRSNRLAVNGKAMAIKQHFIPHDFTASGAISAPVVFVGYGISLPDSGYDDYAGVDVRGKIVVAVSGEPEALAKRRGDTRAAAYAISIEKMRTAARHGAGAFLLLTNPLHSRILRAVGYPWPSLYPSVPVETLPIRLDLPDSGSSRIPSVGISGEVAKELFGGSLRRITELVEGIDTSGRPASMELRSRAELEVSLDKTIIPARNVLGVIPGSRFPNEYVVIGAHYDHVGVRRTEPGTKATGDTIFNGADDNASGTSALLMLADALGSLPERARPARSVLLIAFSAEEKGLFGSMAYVRTPPIPNGQLVAMFNMDMIGRNHPDSVTIGGTDRWPDLGALAVEANRVDPMIFNYDVGDYFYRSDHASFARVGVPVLFFYSGEHADYHRVTDNPDLVDNGKLARIARLCFRTAWLVADAPQRPVFPRVPVDEIEMYLVEP